MPVMVGEADGALVHDLTPGSTFLTVTVTFHAPMMLAGAMSAKQVVSVASPLAIAAHTSRIAMELSPFGKNAPRGILLRVDLSLTYVVRQPRESRAKIRLEAH